MDSFSITKALCFCITAVTFMSPVTSAAEFTGGTGEPNDPYLISTADQLQSISTSGYYNKCFKLVADIDLDPNIPGNEIIIDRPFIASFGGTLDGNGHSISNMVSESYYSGRGGNRSSGLIGFLNRDGIVKDIQLQNITILGVGHFVGALVVANRGMVLQCSVTGSISGESFIGGLVADNYGDILFCSAFCNIQSLPGGPVGVAGGLVGQNYGCIFNCYAIGIVTGEEDLGGLVGVNHNYISNCYAIGTISGDESLGGLVGENTGYVSNCYAIGTVAGDESLGGLIGKSSGQTIHSFWDIQVSGQKISAGGVGLPTAKLQNPENYLSAGWDLAGETSNGLMDLWTISEPNTYPQLTRLTGQYTITQLSGSGTMDNPYKIATAKEFVAINDYDINAHYTLVADIDMSGIVWTTAPIFVFNGTFNGQGNTISNLTIEGGSYLGLFGRILTNGVITNLTIQDAYITGYKYIGALAGKSYGHITYCHTTGNVTGVSFVGGLVGLVNLLLGSTLEESISDCTADVVLSGNNYINNIANVCFYD